MTLAQRFINLKTRVAGNREPVRYEESFGPTIEELQSITPMPRFTVRILSEVEFALRLSAEFNGKYDKEVASALSVLEADMEENGAITKSGAARAEEALLPLEKEAKSYKLILAGHAHIDMNWMWSWTETVAATIATFQTMLQIMDEYPEFCFSQSQTSVYKIIDDYAPELHDKIKARIDEGRWEVTSSAWVETDKNMPGTESLLRHIAYSKKYLSEHWGLSEDKLDLDFSPDTFGHSANLTEIDTYGGVKYYYHCRGYDGPNALYRWRGQSGKEMLVYKEQYWYNGAITPKYAMGLFEVVRNSGGLKTGLVVYGVGDHGGGPTRRDIERGIEMQSWRIFPTIRFGTLHDYFKEAETVREKLNVVDHELNFTFDGCYSTQSRIKRGNRRSEAALSEAETAMAFAHAEVGAPLHNDKLESAWQKVLFTHFHDILTGSCVQDSREHAMGLYQDALATANTETGLALSKLSAEIDTSMVVAEDAPTAQDFGAGAGYNISNFAGRGAVERGSGLTRIWNVFNNTFADKAEAVEITCWDWLGDLRRVSIRDTNGNVLPFQLLDGSLQRYWDHRYFRFIVWLQVPAASYTTIVLKEAEAAEYKTYIGNCKNRPAAENFVLDNGIVRFEFDYSTGAMVSMKDLRDGREFIPAGQSAVLTVIDTNRHNSSAWDIGTHFTSHPVTNLFNIHPTADGPVRKGFAFEARTRSSKFDVEYTLDKGATAVQARIKVDWSEVGGEQVPVLAYELPLAYDTDRFGYNIPAGVAVRPATEADRPGQSYIAALPETDDGKIAAIITDCKYGFRGIRRNGSAHLLSTLINTATGPDPYPERGIHEITLTLGIFDNDAAAMEKEVLHANRPMTALSVKPHKGSLAPAGSFLKVNAPHCAVTAVKADESALYVRLYSLSDKTENVSVKRAGVKTAELVDLLDRPLKGASITVKGDTVSTKIAPKTIITIRIELK